MLGRDIELTSWRRQIGYVSQDKVIFDDTIANNIGLWAGDPGQNSMLRQRIQDAARRAHIAHQLSTIRNVDRVYVLDKGRVVEKGSYRELRNREGSRLGKLIDM